MNAWAVQALSACDRMESGIRNGDQDSIQQARAMVEYWLGDGFDAVRPTFGKAFECLLRKCSAGSLQDLSVFLFAARCYLETDLENGGEDEDLGSGGDGEGPTLPNRAA